MSERFTRRSKIIGGVLAGLLTIIVLVLVRVSVAPSERWADGVSWMFNRLWAEPRGFRVSLGQITGTPLTRTTLVDFRLEGTGRLRFARADTVQIETSLAGFLRRRVALEALVVVSPFIVLAKPAASDSGAQASNGGSVNLEVRDFLIRGGRVEGAILGQERAVDGLDVRGFARVAPDRFALRLDRASATVANPDLRVQSLTGWLTKQGAVLRPKLALAMPGLSVTVSGQASLDPEVPSDLRIGIDELALQEMRGLYPALPDWARGWVSGALYVNGSRQAWETRVSLRGKVRDHPPAGLRARVAKSGESVAVTELTLEMEGARVEGSEIHLDLDSGSFRGNVVAAAVDLRRLALGFDTETDLNARGSLAGRGLEGFPDSLRLELDLGPSRVDRWNIAGGRALCVLGPDRLDVSGLDLRGPGWRCSATGARRRDGWVRGRVSCELTSLEDLGRALEMGLDGRGEIHLELGGEGGDVSGRASADLEGLRIGGASLDTLFANLTFGKSAGPLWVSCFAEGRHVGFGRLQGRKAAVNFRTLGREIEEFQAIGQVDSVLVNLEGRMTDRSGVRTVSLSRAEISSPARLWKNVGPVELVVSRGYELRPSRWESAGGAIEAAASLRSTGELDAAVRAEAANLRALSDVLPARHRLDGTLDLNASIGGSLAEPQVQALMTAYPLVVGAVEMDSLAGALVLDSGRLRLDSLQVVVAGGRGDLRGTLPVDFALGGRRGSRFEILGLGDVSLKVAEFPLEVIGMKPTGETRYGGRLALDAALSGRPENPRGEIQAVVEGARVRPFDLGRVRLRGHVRDRVLVVDEVDIQSDAAAARITGTIPLEAVDRPPWFVPGSSGVSLEVAVEQGRFTFLPVLTPSVFKGSDGAYDLNLSVLGSLADPILDGSLRVRRGRLRLGPLDEEVTSMQADVTLAGHEIRIDRLTGDLGGGPLTADGRVTLDSLRATDYRIRVSAKRSEIRSLLDDVTGVVDADLVVRPDTTDFGSVVPHYSGRVEAHEAQITRELPRAGEGGAPTVAPTWTAELAIEAANNVWVRNSDAEIELDGSIMFKKNAQGMTFLGDLQTVRGRYFLYNNEFRITSGSLRFADVNDIRNALLEIEAETEVATDEGRERISLSITGTIAKPSLAATSESGYSEPEIFRLLALGEEAGGEDQGSATPFSRALARSWGRMLARKFGSELARSLGLDEVEIEPGSGGREFVEGARVGVGKYVSDRLYLKYKHSLAVNPLKGDNAAGGGGTVSRAEAELPDRQLLLEYRLSRLFSLDGEASVVNGKSYFNFDVKFRHRY